MRTSLIALFCLSLTACDSKTTEQGDAGSTPDKSVPDMAETDALAGSADGGGCGGSFPFSGPACCDAQGNRTGSAECVGGQWTCQAPATLCTCAGKPMAFSCSDQCGSDAFFEPTCDNGVWTCGSGVKTSGCPEGTCWGEPGMCCDAKGQPVTPVCKDGEWEWPTPCTSANCA